MRKLMLVLLIMLCAVQAGAETRGDIKRMVKQRRIDFDATRFPDTVLNDFYLSALRSVATVGRLIQKDSTYPVTDTTTKFRLPSDYFDKECLTLNRDPVNQAATVRKVLTWVPRREMGKVFTYQAGRPENWSSWADSLEINRPTQTYLDTLTLSYIAMPPSPASDTSTFPLKAAYVPLVVEYMIAYCMDRIQLTGPSRVETEARLQFFEARLLGRPADEK